MFEDKNRLFIIDGMSLLFRAFYAMGSRLTTPEGVPIGAVYGFMKVIMKLLREQKPTHLAVCWDLKEKTFRHEVFEKYKGNRGEPPSDILPQIPIIKELLVDMQCSAFALPGYEADDLAGSLAFYFQHYGDVFLVTADKDYMQLVNDRIKIISLKKGDEYDVLDREKVFDYFGVFPEQVVDVLALTGDTSDNIPGVKGVGEKTAAKLVSEFQTIENIFENIDKIQNKRIRFMLDGQKEIATLSKYLVTIKTDIPMNVSEFTLRFSVDALKNNFLFQKKLEQLNMRTIANSFFSNVLDHTESAYSNKSNLNGWGSRNYKLIQKQHDIEIVLKKILSLNEKDFFAFDTETTGLDFIEDKPIGISFCFEYGTAYYIPGSDYLWDKLNFVFNKCRAQLVAHNLKFDLHMLHNVGVYIENKNLICTMVAAWVCDIGNTVGYSLDALTLKHFNLHKIPTSSLIGKETGRTSMTEVPLEEISKYACEDAEAVFKLWMLYEQQINLDDEFKKLFFDLEMPILKILAQMERQGVYIDTNYLSILATELKSKLALVEQEIYKIAGFEFKITSPRQLGDVMFEHLKIHETLQYKGKLARTTQGYKTDAAVLEEFENDHFVQLVKQHRELNKLLSTYILSLPNLIKPSTGRLHTSFHQIGTVTGRLSSSDPNLQNVPIRTEWGKRVRAAFTTRDQDHVIISADYSQIELRVLAHLSHDPVMIAAFKSNTDFHRQTAAQIMGKSLDEVTDKERSQAKAINFGIVYGMGPTKLARSQKISLSDAQRFIQKYFATFSKVRAYIDDQRAQAHSLGMVKTLFGRKRLLAGIHSKNQLEVKLAENMAVNTPIQGTSAEIMKLGMIAVDNEIKKNRLSSKVVLQVHDELVLEVPKAEIQIISEILHKTMENVVKFDVPMKVDVEFGNNWSNLSE